MRKTLFTATFITKNPVKNDGYFNKRSGLHPFKSTIDRM